MDKRITLEELQKYLWDSAVLLRTNIDAGSYKQYIFPLLFYKRICDVYDEETANGKTHRFTIPEGFHWNDILAIEENIGASLMEAFRVVEEANGNSLTGVFGTAAWTNKNRISDKLMRGLLEHFGSLTLSLANCPEDELGQGYEYLIKKFADDSGHSAQEFYTNRSVVHLMTEMLQLLPHESVYDPTCGTAGMLVSAIAHLKKCNIDCSDLSAFGQELNPLTAAIGKMNLFLHGVKEFDVVNADTLTAPAFTNGATLRTFDVVLANPPYSISQWNREAFVNDPYGRNFLGTPPQSRADYAFIQHILKSMDPISGRCAILLPHGVLFRREEMHIRENLIKSDLLECVIGLGANLFYNSPMEACILICRSNKEDKHRNKVLFINAVDEVVKKKTQSELSSDHIEKIASAYRLFEDVSGFARVVEQSEIATNSYSLSIPIYVDKTQIASEIYESTDELFHNWEQASETMRGQINTLKELL